jgi:Bacteroidetes VLRF1 release factor
MKIYKEIWKKEAIKSSSEEEGEDIEESKEKIESEKKKKAKKDAKQKNSFWPKQLIFNMSKEFKQDLQFCKHIDIKTTSIKFTTTFEQKFMKENQNIFFINENTEEVLVLNRCMLDRSLDFEEQVRDSNEEKYQGLYDTDDFSAQNYDFSNPKALIERQRKILENLKSKEVENEIKNSGVIDINPLLYIKRLTIILVHGGYFAVGVFENDKCILHRSDHKYVVRKKAGKRQITKDSNSGSNVQSMGSQIRRDQEKKHYEKIKKLLSESYKAIEPSDLILYHAPAMNKYLILGESEPMYPLRKKFRSVCLTTKRANYTEIERIYSHISKIYVVPKEKYST